MSTLLIIASSSGETTGPLRINEWNLICVLWMLNALTIEDRILIREGYLGNTMTETNGTSLWHTNMSGFHEIGKVFLALIDDKGLIKDKESTLTGKGEDYHFIFSPDTVLWLPLGVSADDLVTELWLLLKEGTERWKTLYRERKLIRYILSPELTIGPMSIVRKAQY